MERLKEYLEKLSRTGRDVESVYESCGGNYDDAYSMGIDNGRADLAQELLEQYF